MAKAVSKKSKSKALVKVPDKKAPIKTSDNDRIAYWKGEIKDTWQSAVESIIATGDQLLMAKEELKGRKGAFTKLCDGLPFEPRTAQMLMKIAASPLADPKRASQLPPSWYNLYLLTQLDDKALKQAFAKGQIKSSMERDDIQKLLDAAKPKIDRDAEDADVVDPEDDEPEGDDDNDGDDGDDEEETEVEDEADEPTEPKGGKSDKETTGHVGPKLSRHDKKVDFVAGAIEVLAQRLGEFEEMLDASEEVREAMRSKMSRDMLKRALEVNLIIERLTKKYLKG